MNMRKRISAVILACMMLVFALYQGLQHTDRDVAMENNKGAGEKETLYFWYTDESLGDYLNSCALAFMEEHEDVRIVPTCVSAVEYLETIYDATMEGDVYPDLFVVTNDCLEKAYLSGIATTIQDKAGLVTEENFPGTALSAVTCQDNLVAYPFYYETSLLLYNRTHLENMAQVRQEALLAQAEGEAAQAAADALAAAGEEPDEAALAQAQVQTEEQEEAQRLSAGADALIPGTMDDILNLADEYDAPEGVEAIMKWDVSDIFYNYFFAGNYIDVGGPDGDDDSVIDIYNDNSVQCLNVYQSLNQFFSIEAKETTYDSVLQEFMEGKILFTVATTDAVAKLEQAKQEGQFSGEYAVTLLPDVSGQLRSRGLSVTNVIAVNGYGRHKKVANQFAAFVAGQTDDALYQRCGKLSANLNVTHENEMLDVAMEAYKKSAGLPKLIQASSFWVQLEVTLTGIWQGDDTAQALEKLQQQIESQVK